MENMKFRIESPTQSEALQNVLFSLGYAWRFASNTGEAVQFTDQPYLYADNDEVITYDHDLSYFKKHINKEQNTAEFITKHTATQNTKKENMDNSSAESELTFDINADISRQYTRDGRKVLYIHDTGFAITYPISAVIEGSDQPFAYTKAGQYFNGSVESMIDIVTRPEIKPLIVDYLNVYSDLLGFCGDHNNYADAAEATAGSADFIATIRLTYNPNDGSVSAEIASE